MTNTKIRKFTKNKIDQFGSWKTRTYQVHHIYLKFWNVIVMYSKLQDDRLINVDCKKLILSEELWNIFTQFFKYSEYIHNIVRL